MKFDLPPDEKIEHYWEHVCVLLLEIGHEPEEVLITDESNVGDFFDAHWSMPEEEDEYWQRFKNNIFKKHKVKIKLSDKIWEAAEKIKYGP